MRTVAKTKCKPLLLRCILLVVGVLSAPSAFAHVSLRYPPSVLRNDFLDNVRTTDLCGEVRANSDGANFWQVSEVDNRTSAVVAPGSQLDVSWDLHYAHQGGYMLELYDSDLTLLHRWNDSSHFGDDSCPIDGTVQNVTITVPQEACTDCILRLQRQANEWGVGYLFKSCSQITIADTADACNGCSGHGDCSNAGTCQCTSNAQDGFFYGTHCEYENECEADSHCGARGKCIEIGDVSGPAKQCFCEAGAFGEMQQSSTGLPHRVCSADSALTIPVDDLANFGSEYERSMDSAGGSFSVFWTIRETDISVAVRAQTTSWVGLGLRSVVTGGGTADTDAAAEGEGDGAAAEGGDGAAAEGESSGDTASEGEAEPEAEAEDSGTKAPPAGGGSNEAPEVEAEAEAAPAEQPARRSRSLLEAEPAAAEVADGAAAEGEDGAAAGGEDGAAAEGEDGAAAEGEDGAAAEGEDGAAAEGEDSATRSTGGCPVIPAAQVRSIYILGDGNPVSAQEAAMYKNEETGAAAEGEDGAAAEGEDGAASEGTDGAAAEDTDGAAAEAATRRSLSGAASGMPIVESEAVTKLAGPIHPSRVILESEAESAVVAEDAAVGAAEGEAEGEADAEGGDAGVAADGNTELATVATGPCAGASLTPSSSFAMDNQDVILTVAREVQGVQYYRIVDMFTPSRAKPKPDYEFCVGGQCGTDDITDAIAVEVDGATYIKYTRPLVSSDPTYADACFSEDQSYTLIYALGQLTANATHVPDSTLEILPSASLSNADFYKEDELKFHGGGSGIAASGIAYDGRASLGTVNLFVDDSASGGACTASTEAGFDCMQDFLAGSMTVHWSEGTAADTDATIALELPSTTGWMAMGFPASPGQMIGSTAVICTDDAASGNCGVFDLNGKSVAAVVEQDGSGRRLQQSTAVTLTNAACTRAAGRSICTFTRNCGADFTCDGAPNDILLAQAGSSNLAIHDQRGPVTLALARSAAGSSGSVVTPLLRKQRAHAWLMGLGWGIILPMGVIMANTLRAHGPIWFHLHRAFQTLGLLMTTIGVIIAWTSFEGLEDNDRHRQLGIAVMVIGWMQPLNAFVRPHPPEKDSGEAKSNLRLAWEILHKGVGYVVIALAIYEVFLGHERAKLFSVVETYRWRTAYTAVLIVLAVLWVILAALHFFVWSKHTKEVESVKVDEDNDDIIADSMSRGAEIHLSRRLFSFRRGGSVNVADQN